MAVRVIAAIGMVLLFGLGGVEVVRGEEPSADRPSVLMISLDTLSAKNLGAYGYTRSTSP